MAQRKVQSTRSRYLVQIVTEGKKTQLDRTFTLGEARGAVTKVLKGAPRDTRVRILALTPRMWEEYGVKTVKGPEEITILPVLLREADKGGD